MKIAKIVSSNSHIDYVARVLDARDEGAPPRAADHSFGQFVSVAGEDEKVIGVIYDSRLVNPEYGSFALSSRRVRRTSIPTLFENREFCSEYSCLA
jgi:hypothetical protein